MTAPPRYSTDRALAAVWCLASCAGMVQAAPLEHTVPQPLAFHVTVDEHLGDPSQTRRVYVILCSPTVKEPRSLIKNWFAPIHIFSKEVPSGDIGAGVTVDGHALYYPKTLAQLEPGRYTIQALARCSQDHPVPGAGPGDLYSTPTTLDLHPGQSGPVTLTLQHRVPVQPLEDTDRIRFVEVVSQRLSAFAGRPRHLRAGVLLPKAWSRESHRSYPVLYFCGGFGSDHRHARVLRRSWSRAGVTDLADEVLIVVPDPTCLRGHSALANSATNGPWSDALLEELIPHIENKFRGSGSAHHRYLTGVSSGAWSCLWLQTRYPDQFNGCWAHVPDPVDFRDFQQIDLYAPAANVYHDEEGARRPIARFRGRVMLWYDDFVKRETALGPGGQIGSFEAVFSPKGPRGEPLPLFDRRTGAVDPRVAEAWKAYDISLLIRQQHSELKPKLSSKLHVYGGQTDNFYLGGSVKRLKATLEQHGIAAEIRVVPGMSHRPFTDSYEPMFKTILEQFRSAPGQSDGATPPTPRATPQTQSHPGRSGQQ